MWPQGIKSFSDISLPVKKSTIYGRGGAVCVAGRGVGRMRMNLRD